MEPTIVFEDDQLLVIDKPSGMTVNRADTTRGEQTLQDFVVGYLQLAEPEIMTTPDGYRNAFLERSGIVHRLDKETSGLILVAKTENAFLALQKQFKERTVQKRYIALVHGEVKPDSGEIDVPIGRQEWNRMRFGVVAGGKEAQTRYKTISNFKFQMSNEILTLLELEPKTGRTHQLRVHMKYLGYPLFADFLYAGRKTQRNDRKYLSRVFLHAAKITFSHPSSKETINFESALPNELQEFLDKHSVVVN